MHEIFRRFTFVSFAICQSAKWNYYTGREVAWIAARECVYWTLAFTSNTPDYVAYTKRKFSYMKGNRVLAGANLVTFGFRNVTLNDYLFSIGCDSAKFFVNSARQCSSRSGRRRYGNLSTEVQLRNKLQNKFSEFGRASDEALSDLVSAVDAIDESGNDAGFDKLKEVMNFDGPAPTIISKSEQVVSTAGGIVGGVTAAYSVIPKYKFVLEQFPEYMDLFSASNSYLYAQYGAVVSTGMLGALRLYAVYGAAKRFFALPFKLYKWFQKPAAERSEYWNWKTRAKWLFDYIAVPSVCIVLGAIASIPQLVMNEGYSGDFGESITWAILLSNILTADAGFKLVWKAVSVTDRQRIEEFFTNWLNRINRMSPEAKKIMLSEISS